MKILNTNFKFAILQRGYLSEEFSIQCGCRQQDQVAPSLFIPNAEIRSILIKQNREIKVIIIKNKEYKLIKTVCR